MFIGLEIRKVNDELVIVSKYLNQRKLTSSFYINEFFRLCNKIVLMNNNQNEEIVKL